MIEFVFLLPLVAGGAALALPASMGRMLLCISALLHFQLTLMSWMGKLTPAFPQFFSASPEGLLILLVTSFIFVCISIYSFSYMNESEVENKPVFCCCMLLFLGTMSMVTLSEHPIVLWISIEATTLVSAPLIFIHRSKEALEATWKYVLICSVGIALALLGCFFVTLAMDLGNIDAPLSFTSLNNVAMQLGSGMAQSRIHLCGYWIWYKNGPCTNAHLVTGCAQPGTKSRICLALRSVT